MASTFDEEDDGWGNPFAYPAGGKAGAPGSSKKSSLPDYGVEDIHSVWADVKSGPGVEATDEDPWTRVQPPLGAADQSRASASDAASTEPCEAGEDETPWQSLPSDRPGRAGSISGRAMTYMEDEAPDESPSTATSALSCPADRDSPPPSSSPAPTGPLDDQTPWQTEVIDYIPPVHAVPAASSELNLPSTSSEDRSLVFRTPPTTLPVEEPSAAATAAASEEDAWGGCTWRDPGVWRGPDAPGSYSFAPAFPASPPGDDFGDFVEAEDADARAGLSVLGARSVHAASRAPAPVKLPPPPSAPTPAAPPRPASPSIIARAWHKITRKASPLTPVKVDAGGAGGAGVAQAGGPKDRGSRFLGRSKSLREDKAKQAAEARGASPSGGSPAASPLSSPRTGPATAHGEPEPEPDPMDRVVAAFEGLRPKDAVGAPRASGAPGITLGSSSLAPAMPPPPSMPPPPPFSPPAMSPPAVSSPPGQGAPRPPAGPMPPLHPVHLPLRPLSPLVSPPGSGHAPSASWTGPGLGGAAPSGRGSRDLDEFDPLRPQAAAPGGLGAQTAQAQARPVPPPLRPIQAPFPGPAALSASRSAPGLQAMPVPSMQAMPAPSMQAMPAPSMQAMQPLQPRPLQPRPLQPARPHAPMATDAGDFGDFVAAGAGSSASTGAGSFRAAGPSMASVPLRPTLAPTRSASPSALPSQRPPLAPAPAPAPMPAPPPSFSMVPLQPKPATRPATRAP